MKINQTYVATVIIGIIVGALIVGIIDANRAKPLFSGSSSKTAPAVTVPSTTKNMMDTNKTVPTPKAVPSKSPNAPTK